MRSNAATRETVGHACRVVLPTVVRLRDMPDVLAAVRDALKSGADRIELDACAVQLLSEGARRLLLAATERLAAMDVLLVLVDCDPFE